MALRAAVAALTSNQWGSPLRLLPDGSPRRKASRDDRFADRLRSLEGASRSELLIELRRALARAIETRQSKRVFDSHLAGGVDALVAAIEPQAFRAALGRNFERGRFFDRAPGAVAKMAALEAGAGAIKGNKAELAARAIEIAERTGWLPGPLRTVHYEGPTGFSRPRS